jgi:hypothetical protein
MKIIVLQQLLFAEAEHVGMHLPKFKVGPQFARTVLGLGKRLRFFDRCEIARSIYCKSCEDKRSV